MLRLGRDLLHLTRSPAPVRPLKRAERRKLVAAPRNILGRECERSGWNEARVRTGLTWLPTVLVEVEGG